MLNADRTAPPDKALLAALCEFNFLPSRYLHDSWLSTLPHGDVLGKLRACPRARYQVSRYLLARFGLHERYWFDVSEPLSRIALLPGPDIATLVLHAGLCCYSRRIQHAVLREDVLALRERLGEDAYLFALKRAPFLAPAPEGPAAWPWTAAACRGQALLAGVCCLGSAFSGQPTALLRRLMLKLPRHWHTRIAHPPWRLDQHQAATLLGKLVIELKLFVQTHGDLPQA